MSLNSVPRLLADDTTLCVNENSFKNLEILANHKLKKNLSRVLNGLTFYHSKPQALSNAPFTHKSSPFLSLNFRNNIVNITNTAKYLGLLIDVQLPFKSHINFCEKKLSFSVGIIAKFS